jgi:hypothetical protein
MAEEMEDKIIVKTEGTADKKEETISLTKLK